jgi:hypothetical protein
MVGYNFGCIDHISDGTIGIRKKELGLRVGNSIVDQREHRHHERLKWEARSG